MKLKRIWFIGLAAIVAIAAIAYGQPLKLGQQSPFSAIVQAQTPTPAPETSPIPEVTPTPEITPAPEVTPTPTATPAPAETPPSPSTPPTPPTSIPEIAPPPPSALPLAENPYQDPSGRFQVGIIQEFNQSVVTGVPLFESSDGQLAYTVTVRPRLSNRPLEPWILIQVATDTFARGEGMIVQELEPVNTELGGAIAPWMGTLTMGKNQQPMQGILLSRQVPGQLLILAIAATEGAADRIDAVYSTLEPTLQGIEK